jgi:hypothetical protein
VTSRRLIGPRVVCRPVRAYSNVTMVPNHESKSPEADEAQIVGFATSNRRVWPAAVGRNLPPATSVRLTEIRLKPTFAWEALLCSAAE